MVAVLRQDAVLPCLPRTGTGAELDFSVSNSFSQFHGAVKRIVFFLLNGVFLPKTALSNETPSTEESPHPPLKCHNCCRASWNCAKGTVTVVGRGVNSESEVSHREGGREDPAGCSAVGVSASSADVGACYDDMSPLSAFFCFLFLIGCHGDHDFFLLSLDWKGSWISSDTWAVST